MITTTYTCDRCGYQQDGRPDDPRPMRVISVLSEPAPGSSGTVAKIGPARLWCEVCLLETRLIRPGYRGGPPPAEQKPPSLDDLIREIVGKKLEEEGLA